MAERSEDMRASLDQWWSHMRNYYKTLYNKELQNTRNQFDKTRNSIAHNSKMEENRVRELVGPEGGGRGAAMMARVFNNRAGNFNDARNWLGETNATSKANYDLNLANAYRSYMDRLAALTDYSTQSDATATGNYSGSTNPLSNLPKGPTIPNYPSGSTGAGRRWTQMTR